MNRAKLIKLAERLAIPLPSEMPPLESFTEFHFNTSGGKDSIALALLMLYGYKVPRHKVKFVHMRVDGPESEEAYFDYPETDAYLTYAAEKLGLELVMIASDKGFKQRIVERGKFPAPNAQYCTSSLKRDVYAKWVRKKGPGHYLCLSGERSLESSRRLEILSKGVFREYPAANAPTKGRFVDWYRPIHHLTETDVWTLMEHAGIEPHPCYTKYDMSRCSCKFCFYLSPKEMLSVSKAFPEEFEALCKLEEEMGHTMRFEKGKPITLREYVAKAERDYDQISFDEYILPCQSVV
ncbi:phosphoadenosine phosphosulfate reductase family protein [Bacillus salitolerans]|uniref:Phosphoadenosine phosphosulfate reductase family protein n=1 Tax=Bacillus salitolerans TaxID=1437434 RepID=A0ABW4LLM8_9BACI